MRKIYSLVLLAAALLIGTNAWAATYNVDVATYDALIAAVEGPTGTGEYVAGDIVNITLTSDLTYSLENYPSPYAATDAHLTAAKNHISEIHRGQVVNVNLNNHNITSQALFVFAVYYGKLNLTGHGTITNTLYRYKENTKTSTKVAEASVVWMAGINQANCATDRTYLNVGPDVTLNCPNGKCGVYVYQLPTDNGYTTNTCKTNKGVTKNWSAKTSDAKPKVCAYGVYADIYGTVHGYRYGLQMSGLINEVNIPSESNTPSIPTYYIHTGATVSAGSDLECAGLYLGGFSRAIISGTVFGATGVYIKSGLAEVIDATIYSNSSDYEAPKAGSSGKDATGSGIVIDSNVGYAGQIDVTISGDTKVTGNGGYAVEEKITTKDQANVSNVTGITIEGGTFEGGNQGCANFDNQTVTEADDPTDETHIDIISGNYSGSSTDEEKEQISNLIEATGGEVNMVTDPETGKSTMVVATDPVPETDKTKPTTLADAYTAQTAGEEHIYLTLSTSGTSTVDANLTLEKLDMSTGDHLVIVNNGITLTVGRVVMGYTAKIIVEPGGKFIVTGTQGIMAPSVDNITLKTSETAQATFLFNPAVSSNRHPNATVEFKTYAHYYANPGIAWQRFGIPTYNNLQSIAYKNPANQGVIRTWIYDYNAVADDWNELGEVGVNLNATSMNRPFAGYMMECNATTEGTEFVMTGELVGNTDANLYANMTYTTFANSFTAPIKMRYFYDKLGNGVAKGLYLAKRNGHAYTFETFNDLMGDLDGTMILPMQSFILYNPSMQTALNNIGYEEMVYNPAMGLPHVGAPARHVDNDMTKIIISIEDEYGSKDRLGLAKSDLFTDGFDNGYDMPKLMNDELNIFISEDDYMSTMASNEIENTYLGFSCKEAGNYTINIVCAEGEEFVLQDLSNNALILMTNNASYQFYANENERNDYRFKIVSRQEMPTAVETIEKETINNDGIYTITGQYVGEMSIWNSLPEGMYIVNGVKKIK